MPLTIPRADPFADDGLVWRVGYYKGIRSADFDRYYLKNPEVNGRGPKDPCWVWTRWWSYVYKSFFPAPDRFLAYGGYTNEDVRKHVPNRYVWSVVRGPIPEKLTFPDDSVLMGIRVLDL